MVLQNCAMEMERGFTVMARQAGARMFRLQAKAAVNRTHSRRYRDCAGGS